MITALLLASAHARTQRRNRANRRFIAATRPALLVLLGILVWLLLRGEA